jgi:mitogen-activated protein kinase kinase
MLSPPLLNVPTPNSIQSSTTQSPSVGGSAVHDRNATDEDDELDISPGALQDLGRLGEGASGEVRKVLHKPTGLVMAKKVSFLSTVSLRYGH